MEHSVITAILARSIHVLFTSLSGSEECMDHIEKMIPLLLLTLGAVLLNANVFTDRSSCFYEDAVSIRARSAVQGKGR